MGHRPPISIAVTKVQCVDDTEEFDSDEPFVVVFVADVSRRIAVPGSPTITIPSAATTVTGPWNDADAGETLETLPILPILPRDSWNKFEAAMGQVLRKPCWAFDGGLAVIQDPDDVIILAAVVEEDSRGHESLRGIVHGLMFASVTALINDVVNGQMSRATMIARLREDMESAIEAGRKTSVPDFSDKVGKVQELRLTDEDLDVAGHGTRIRRLSFGAGGDEGGYRVRFELRNRSFLAPAA